MTVGKSLVAFLAICYLAVLIIGCSAKDGPTGPPGFQGQEGPPGQNRIAIPMADRTFGILIANNSAADLAGAMNVLMTSDSTLSPAADRVVARTITTSPLIDGVDGGSAEWGNAAAATITLGSVAGSDNGITSARMRVGYDRQSFYMQIQWTEVEQGSFVPGADVAGNIWTYDSTSATWSQSGGEDELLLGWQLTDVTGWSTEGMSAIFDGTNFRTPEADQFADLWVWQSTQTNYTGYLADKVVSYVAAGDGSDYDLGFRPAFVLVNNLTDGHPTYMQAGSPAAGSAYPLTSYNYALFNSNIKWLNHATVPGYISFSPSGSTSDIEMASSYSDGIWTVELRRLRQTGYGDDAKF